MSASFIFATGRYVPGVVTEKFPLVWVSSTAWAPALASASDAYLVLPLFGTDLSPKAIDTYLAHRDLRFSARHKPDVQLSPRAQQMVTTALATNRTGALFAFIIPFKPRDEDYSFMSAYVANLLGDPVAVPPEPENQWLKVDGRLIAALQLHLLKLTGPWNTRMPVATGGIGRGPALAPDWQLGAPLPASDGTLPVGHLGSWRPWDILAALPQPALHGKLFTAYPRHHALPLLDRDLRYHSRDYTALDTIERLRDFLFMQEVLLGADLSRYNELKPLPTATSWYLGTYTVRDDKHYLGRGPGRRDAGLADGLRATAVISHIRGLRSIGVFGWDLTTWASIDLDLHDAAPGHPKEHRQQVERLLRAVGTLYALFPNAVIEARYEHSVYPSAYAHLARKGKAPWAPCYRLADGRVVHRHPYDAESVVKGAHVWLRFGGWYPTADITAYLADLCRRHDVGVSDGIGVEVFPASSHSMTLPLRCGQTRTSNKRYHFLQYELVDQHLLPLVRAARWKSGSQPAFMSPKRYLQAMWSLWSSWTPSIVPGTAPAAVEIPEMLSFAFESSEAHQPKADEKQKHPSLMKLRLNEAMPNQPKLKIAVGPVRLHRAPVEKVGVVSYAEKWAAGLSDAEVDHVLEMQKQGNRVDIEALRSAGRGGWNTRQQPRAGAAVQRSAPSGRQSRLGAARPVPAPEIAANQDKLARPLSPSDRNDRTLQIVRFVQGYGGEIEEAEAILRKAHGSGTSKTSWADARAALVDAWQRSEQWRREKSIRPARKAPSLSPDTVRRIQKVVEDTVKPMRQARHQISQFVKVTKIIVSNAMKDPIRAQRCVMAATWLRKQAGSYGKAYKQWLRDHGCVAVQGERCEAYDIRALLTTLGIDSTEGS